MSECIVKDAMREARDITMNAAIELCELVRDSGGCANCCIEQLKMLQRDQHAGDLAADAIERARHAQV